MILLAEDEILNRMLLERFVEKLGYNAICVENGEEVIKQITNQKFDLIIIDISMPIIDGIEAIEYIRTHETTNKATPITLLSGTYPNNFAELQSKFNISEIIIKPFIIQDIKNCIENCFK